MATEQISSVEAEEIYSVASEEISSVATEEISSVATDSSVEQLHFPAKAPKGARADTPTTLEICPAPGLNARQDEISRSEETLTRACAENRDMTEHVKRHVCMGHNFLPPKRLLHVVM